MANIEDSIQDIKEKIPNITPTPPGLKAQSSAHDLKARLEWGEPAFTIIDVRDRNAFNDAHILGAMSMPMEDVVNNAKDSIDLRRDIYVYGESDAETSQIADKLREAGFHSVAELRGGLGAWKAIAGPTEGIIESQAVPGKEAYNVASQVKHHSDTQKSSK